MDKRTILAVVLSVTIIIIFTFVQGVFVKKKPTQKMYDNNLSSNELLTEDEDEEDDTLFAEKESNIIPVSSNEKIESDVGKILQEIEFEREEMAAETDEKIIVFKTDVFEITFSTLGANIISLKLLKFKEMDGSFIDMILSGDTGISPFNINLDEYDTGKDVFMQIVSYEPNIIEFVKTYIFKKDDQEIPFILKKTYIFKDNEYMMEFRVTVETTSKEEKNIPLERYFLSFGPQIGPKFTKLDGRNDYRKFIYFANGKRKDHSGKVKKGKKYLEIDDQINWVAIEGKYFLVIGKSYISDSKKVKIGFDAAKVNGISDQASILFSRKIIKNVKLNDGYKFYIGPKKRDILINYNESDKNGFEESGLHLEYAVPGDFWGWLSTILKWLLEFFYHITHNWGVAIILLTMLIKVLFWPITHKSFESTAKMQALGPKMEEIKIKYKNNPQKLNTETAALYKREGVNPLGGCLPLLLQMPIFFALYGLFSNYFELRGAAFILPWISDLSSPEKVLTLPFALPFLGSELRLLPFIMLATTFIQQKITQTPGQSNSQTKMLMYAMPAFFFFIMYNMPSGLLLYWIMQNFFSFIQQYYNTHLRKKRDSNNSKGAIK